MNGYGRGDYGLDAPSFVRFFEIAGTACALGGFLLPDPWRWFLLGPGLAWLATASWMTLGSRIFKLSLREQLLDSLMLVGDETVLDVGCGRGLLLTAAARRLPRGTALGIDRWQEADQSGNRPSATMENSAIEGVADRVRISTADARSLPFASNSIDAVISSWALHNIPDRAGRERACHEIARVLKQGGLVLIEDILRTRDYRSVFESLGWSEIVRRGPNLVFLIPSFTLVARKGGR